MICLRTPVDRGRAEARRTVPRWPRRDRAGAEVEYGMAEETAAARGEEEYDGAVTHRSQDKTGVREGDFPRPHPALIEIVRLLARAEARRLRS